MTRQFYTNIIFYILKNIYGNMHRPEKALKERTALFQQIIKNSKEKHILKTDITSGILLALIRKPSG